MDKVKLWYCIEGDPIYSSVSIPSSQTIDDLKKLIYNEKDKSLRCNAADLILTKVHYIMIST